jgi:energy-coupling factor transport system permease protein
VSPARDFPGIRRNVHPAAWWVWALGLATAVSLTTNPLLLGTALGVLCLVVAARRGTSPWARAFRLYLVLGAVIVVLRLVLHVLVGVKFGDHLVVDLPTIELPSWAAGISLGGPVYLEGLVSAGVLALRLAVLIACLGAANALANPKRLLRVLPSALHEVGAAVVVSLTVAPQLAESALRVGRARQLRGESSRGLRAVRQVALPVLQDTLDRSLMLASAMDSRGYGRRTPGSGRQRKVTAALTLGGLLLACVGIYGLLDAQSPALLGLPALSAGLLLSGLGLWQGGRSVRHTAYRPDPWRLAEWLTCASGVAAAVAMVATARLQPESLVMPVAPLAVPALPVVATAGLLLGAVPAVATPRPPLGGRRPRAAVVRAADEVTPGPPGEPAVQALAHPGQRTARPSAHAPSGRRP